MDRVKVYGADWCEDTQETRAHLDALGVGYDYINVEQDPQAEAFIKRHNHGKRQTPTVSLGGEILVEPDNEQLDDALRRLGGANH
jgi:glutaredoxin